MMIYPVNVYALSEEDYDLLTAQAERDAEYPLTDWGMDAADLYGDEDAYVEYFDSGW